MDFSAFLILPFSALVAFITLIGAALFGRSKPRLIWPFAISSLLAVSALFSMPRASEIEVWLFEMVMVVPWSAGIGTLIGAILARVTIATVRLIKSR
jgi:hypothetical protein